MKTFRIILVSDVNQTTCILYLKWNVISFSTKMDHIRITVINYMIQKRDLIIQALNLSLNLL